MALVILGVGKVREKWLKEGCAEYVKRLSRFGGAQIIEVPDQSEPEHAAPALLARLTQTEGRAILAQIKPADRVVALCVNGKPLSSEELAASLERYAMDGRRTVYVIGGSRGLSDEVLARADERISFSRMTFPHQLMRVILLEQLYRAQKIRANEPYHK